MARFDLLQNLVFNVPAALFGEPATWTPGAGGDQMSAQVFFKDPSELVGFARKGQHIKMPEFEPGVPLIEYKAGDFPGLFESVSNKKVKEYVFVNAQRYYITKVVQKFDGKIYYASAIISNA